jgi:hypothetical protein
MGSILNTDEVARKVLFMAADTALKEACIDVIG